MDLVNKSHNDGLKVHFKGSNKTVVYINYCKNIIQYRFIELAVKQKIGKLLIHVTWLKAKFEECVVSYIGYLKIL